MTGPRVALRVRPGTLGRRLARELLPDPGRVGLDVREVALRLVEPAVAVPTLARCRLGDQSWELLGLPEPAWIPAASLERPEPGIAVVREPSPCLGSTSVEVSHPVLLDSSLLFVELRAEPAAAIVRQLGPDALPVGGAISVDLADIVECVVLDGDPERLPASSQSLDPRTLDAFLRRLLGLSAGPEVVLTARDLLDRRPAFPRQHPQDPTTEPRHVARPATPPGASTAAAQPPAVSFAASPDTPHGASAPTGGAASPLRAAAALTHARLDPSPAPVRASTPAIVGGEVTPAAPHLRPPPAASPANVHTRAAALDTADEPTPGATILPTPSAHPPFRSPGSVVDHTPEPGRSPSTLTEIDGSTRSAPDLWRPPDDRAAPAAPTAAVVSSVSRDITRGHAPQQPQRRAEPAVTEAGSPDAEAPSQPSTAARSAPAAPSAPPRTAEPDVTSGIDAVVPVRRISRASQGADAAAPSSRPVPQRDPQAAASSPDPTPRLLSRLFAEPRASRPTVDDDADGGGATAHRARLLRAVVAPSAPAARLRPPHDRTIDRIEVDLSAELERVESKQDPPAATIAGDRRPAEVGGLLQMIPRSPRFGGLL